jgi:acyl dehydratase
MSKSSLIPQEALALIGKESAPITREVYAKDIRRFCYAVGDLNPLYLDEAFAGETRFGGIIAPPMFFDIPTVLEHSQEELRADGLPLDGLLPPIKAARSMAGGNEIEFFKAVRIGDRITRISKIADIYEKEGRSGPLVFTIIENRYSNQDGELVAVDRMTAISW